MPKPTLYSVYALIPPEYSIKYLGAMYESNLLDTLTAHAEIYDHQAIFTAITRELFTCKYFNQNLEEITINQYKVMKVVLRGTHL